MDKQNLHDMTKGNPLSLLWKFSLPMLVGNIFQQLYSMVDSIVLGKYVGSDAVGAVGVTGSISFLFFSLTMGLAIGIGIIVSQYFGAGDIDNLKKTIATSIYVIVISSVIMGLIMTFFARSMLKLLNTPDVQLNDATIYLQITGIGMLVVGIYNGISSIIRSLGDAKTPLIFLCVACVVNIILDLVFVIMFNMGVMGVAYGTIISQAVAGIGCCIYAYIKIPVFRMPLKEYRVNKHILNQSLALGIPVALQNSFIAISCIALQWVVNDFGAVIVNAFAAVGRIEQIVQQPFNSLGAAVSTYTGQNMGIGDKERIKKGFWAATKLNIIFCIIIVPLFWIFGPAIMTLFTNVNDPNYAQVIAQGALGLKITSLFYVLLGMIYVTRSVLNGAGDVKFSLVSGIVEVVGRLGFAKPLTLIPFIGMLSIWYTTGLTWTITGIIGCWRYFSGAWQTKGIIEHPKGEELAEGYEEAMSATQLPGGEMLGNKD